MDLLLEDVSSVGGLVIRRDPGSSSGRAGPSPPESRSSLHRVSWRDCMRLDRGAPGRVALERRGARGGQRPNRSGSEAPYRARRRPASLVERTDIRSSFVGLAPPRSPQSLRHLATRGPRLEGNSGQPVTLRRGSHLPDRLRQAPRRRSPAGRDPISTSPMTRATTASSGEGGSETAQHLAP